MGKKEIMEEKEVILPEQIKAEYKNLTKPEIIRVSNRVNKELFDETALDMPIYAYRIIFNIIADLRNKQFQDQNSQLSLEFQENFRNDNNTYARFTFSIKNISGDQQLSRLEKALAFLENFKKGWVTDYNSKGQKVKTLSGLIVNPTYTERGKVSFLMNHYWIKQILNVQMYNEAVYSIADKFSSRKHMLFYMWLLLIDPEKGTKIHVDTLNKRYALNYKTKSEMIRSFLLPIKKRLDIYGNISFNIDKDENDKNIIRIAVYKNVPKKGITANTRDKLIRGQKKFYILKRHSFSEEQKSRITTALKYDSTGIVIEAYHQLIKYYRYTQKIATEQIEIDESFFSYWNNLIKKIYESTERGKKHPEFQPII